MNSSPRSHIVMEKNGQTKLPWRLKLAYSVGHVLNDLCACMWFTYLLLYFHFVLRLSNTLSGVVLLVGQIADAIATPFVGIEVDRTDGFRCRYGRRKSWHLFGTICVLGTFPFLFIECIGCSHSHEWAKLIYYLAFVIIFQFAWASVQISHLALIPNLTADTHERTELNAFRYSFTVSANICVYVVTWIVLGISFDPENPGEHEKIGPEDASKFRNIVLVITGVGALHAFMFHIGVKELDSEKTVISQLQSFPAYNKDNTNWKSWFSKRQFYLVGVLYMFTRLTLNISQVYMPLYLQDTLRLQEESIAVIPLVMFSSGFISSFFMKSLNKHAGRKLTYFIGGCFVITACIWIKFGNGPSYNTIQIYFVAMCIGIGDTALLVTSLAITTDLIGNNLESGAFVYGAMSFTDKLLNGITIIVIQYLNPCQTCCFSCDTFYRDVLVWVCGGATVLAFIPLLSLRAFKTPPHREENGYAGTDDENTPILVNRS